MKKILFLWISIIVLAGCSLKKPLLSFGSAQVCSDQKCFSAEVADEADERREGLMHRKSLGDEKGMLFVFEQPRARITFRMKNTLIPLDMIRLDTTWQVIYIEENVPPCTSDPCPTYGPKAAELVGKYVLELNAGKAKENNIQLGDMLTIK